MKGGVPARLANGIAQALRPVSVGRSLQLPPFELRV
jgi:hypothetical protein